MITATAAPEPGGAEPSHPEVLLDIRDLRTYFHVMDGTVRAVDGISFSIRRGQTLGVVGRVGLRQERHRPLDHAPPSTCRRPRSPSGEIWFEGRDLLALPESEMRERPRQRDRHDLPGADDQPQPGLHRG